MFGQRLHGIVGRRPEQNRFRRASLRRFGKHL
jgi:hypothetical protein